MLNKKDLKLNLLVAFPYFKKGMTEEFGLMNRDDYRLIVDSGAFTAYNCGKVIKLDDYHSFIKTVQHLQPDAFIQLDKVFDPEGTRLNLQKSRDAGFNVCPVFTRGDEIKYFEKLIDDKEYVFIGGIQQGEGAKPFVKFILERYSKEKIHFLAFVRPDWLIHYAPYSTDSSSWSSSVRYGACDLFNHRTGFIKRFSKELFRKRPDEKVTQLFFENGIDWNMIKKLSAKESWIHGKFNPERLFDNSPSCMALHVFISFCSWIRYTIAYQNKLGTKIYIAINGGDQLRMLKFAHHHLKTKGVI